MKDAYGREVFVGDIIGFIAPGGAEPHHKSYGKILYGKIHYIGPNNTFQRVEIVKCCELNNNFEFQRPSIYIFKVNSI
jgi:hypothetical protein